jgi:FKBP-type peptidyl-prolyl cis-trans isomerase
MKLKTTVLILSMISVSLFAKPKASKAKEAEKNELKKQHEVDTKNLSIAFGHLISKTINDIGVSFDLDLVIQGLKDASNGVPSPLSESECMSAISQEQKKAFDALAAKNLTEAETFLSKESKQAHMKSLDDGKVLYKVLNEGQGPEVANQGKVAIRYKGSLLNGEVFGESSKDEILDMSQIVIGLRNAMVGMKEGEKRLIHIHPEKAYGTEGMLPPNSLLSFEIEIAKANVEEVAQNPENQNEQQALEPESEIR